MADVRADGGAPGSWGADTWAGVSVESTTPVGWSTLVTCVLDEVSVGDDGQPLVHRRGRWLRGCPRRGTMSDEAIRVMVVDDHPMWRDAVERDPEAAGFEVVAVAANGNEALARFPRPVRRWWCSTSRSPARTASRSRPRWSQQDPPRGCSSCPRPVSRPTCSRP